MVGDLIDLADMNSANSSSLSFDEFAEALEREQAQVGLGELWIVRHGAGCG